MWSCRDPIGSVTVVDATTMKAIGRYSFIDTGRCNGLALDVKNQVLFAACGYRAIRRRSPHNR